MSENFIKELEEDIKHDHMILFFQRYKRHLIALIASILLGTLAFIFWQNVTETRKLERFQQYDRALVAAQNNDWSTAEPLFEQLALGQTDGYARLALLNLISHGCDDIRLTFSTVDVQKVQGYIQRLKSMNPGNSIKTLVDVAISYALVNSTHAEQREQSRAIWRNFDTPKNPWRFFGYELSILDETHGEKSLQSLLNDAQAPQSFQNRAILSGIAHVWSFQKTIDKSMTNAQSDVSNQKNQ